MLPVAPESCRLDEAEAKPNLTDIWSCVDSFHDGDMRKFHDKTVRVRHRSDFITEEYAIHSQEVTECGIEVAGQPFGHPIPPNTSQYGPVFDNVAGSRRDPYHTSSKSTGIFV
jgi:hypothetical protein